LNHRLLVKIPLRLIAGSEVWKLLEFSPLGFSDLTNDEALVVLGFRHWQSSGSTCAEAEDSLIEAVRNDILHGGPPTAF
jgi:hypothetical protein